MKPRTKFLLLSDHKSIAYRLAMPENADQIVAGELQTTNRHIYRGYGGSPKNK